MNTELPDSETDVSARETLYLPALTASELDASLDDVRVAGTMRDTATYEAASLSPALVDVEARALSAALKRWQAQRGWSLRELAREAQKLIPPDLSRGVTSATLARWIAKPQSLRVAHFAALRATVAALGFTMYDVADVLALARGRALQAQYGEQLVEREAAATLARAQARWDAERELVAHFRSLDDPETRAVIVAQVRGLAHAQRALKTGGATVEPSALSALSASTASASAPTETPTETQADAALGAVLAAIAGFEQRALRMRPATPSATTPALDHASDTATENARVPRPKRRSAG